jgi:hypothetical protein
MFLADRFNGTGIPVDPEKVKLKRGRPKGTKTSK